jgi:hypothetical protein
VAPPRDRLHAGPGVPRRDPRGRGGKRPDTSGDDELIALSVPEIRRLLAFTVLLLAFTVLLLVPTIATVTMWSTWRRRHQRQAQISHYQRRSECPP